MPSSGPYPSWSCVCGQTNVGPAPCSRCFSLAPPWAYNILPTERPWRPSALHIALAVVISVLLIAGLAGAVTVSDSRSSTAAAGTTLLVTTSPPATAGQTELRLAELMRFAEGARGLTFTKPVKVSLLDDKAFRARFRGLSSDGATDDAGPDTTAAVLQALGLIEPGTDLRAAFDQFTADAVAGFYDPRTDDLVVRGENLSPATRVTLVHELTHALQDQHFDIIRRDLQKRDDESYDGFKGLVEGDAVRVQRLYFGSLPEADQKEAEREDAAAAAGIGNKVPPALLNLLYFPYIFGPEFTTAVVAAGGQPRLDEAYREPPSTSEHLMHPELYLAGQGPLPVTAPKAGGKKIDEGVLGELGLLLVISEGAQDDGQLARTAARGWGGDRYIAWKAGKRACVRATIVMDTPTDTAELIDALTRLAKTRKGVTVRGDGPVTLTSCA
jgi:uncharacterized membrane protein